jgi:hypothetical protein
MKRSLPNYFLSDSNLLPFHYFSPAYHTNRERVNMNNRNKTKMIQILSGYRYTILIVQVADTQRKRDKGLMFVEKLPDNEGCYLCFQKKHMAAFG